MPNQHQVTAMVEGNGFVTHGGGAVSSKREAVKASSSSSRWRSTGWAPLAYPSSSFYRSSVPNPHFPLHRDVLLAATRELLVLTGTVDGSTLQVRAKSVPVLTPSDSQMTRNTGDECDTTKRPAKRKRKSPSGGFTSFSKKTKVVPPSHGVVTVEEEPLEEEHLPSAEALADSIVNSSLIVAFRSEGPVLGADEVKVETATALKTQRPPRKVSDADGDVSLSGHIYSSTGTQLLVNGTGVSSEGRDLSLFLNLLDRNSDGSYPLLRRDLPPLLEVSIVSESKLREAAQQMTTKLAAAFDDNALRLFLGYKSSVMKRDRLLRVLSEFLFDVSHALFAWEETESEILSERASDSLSSASDLDAAVRDSLFDRRALNKIGGFDNSSLLPHAVSIGRLRKRNVRWKDFAKTTTGRRMLRHHRNGKSFAVGQKRRGHRLRPRSLKRPHTCEEGRRSRSSSVTSSDGTESEGEATKCHFSTLESASESTRDIANLFDGMPDLMRLTLKRPPGKSWGVLLSKEGEHCLVVRAPKEGNEYGSAGLCCGDMILTVENERGETVIPPSTGAVHCDSAQDWFRKVVSLFKTSHELHFLVRRVGSLGNVGVEN